MLLKHLIYMDMIFEVGLIYYIYYLSNNINECCE